MVCGRTGGAGVVGVPTAVCVVVVVVVVVVYLPCFLAFFFAFFAWFCAVLDLTITAQATTVAEPVVGWAGGKGGSGDSSSFS